MAWCMPVAAASIDVPSAHRSLNNGWAVRLRANKIALLGVGSIVQVLFPWGCSSAISLGLYGCSTQVSRWVRLEHLHVAGIDHVLIPAFDEVRVTEKELVSMHVDV